MYDKNMHNVDYSESQCSGGKYLALIMESHCAMGEAWVV
jgi:hypothetical protein